jgi:hypothetical protein
MESLGERRLRAAVHGIEGEPLTRKPASERVARLSHTHDETPHGCVLESCVVG